MRNRGTFRRLPRTAFEPLRITARLQCGAITDVTLPLDAVLYYQAMRDRYGEQAVTWPGADHPAPATGVSLPLMRCEEQGPNWYYAASFATWPETVATGQDHWNKRLDLSLVSLIDFSGKRAKVDPGSGPMKAYHMPVWYRHALTVTWYVMGHRESVEPLIRATTHLGKKTSQGWGAVLDWSIETWHADWSVRGPEGELMRATPAEHGVLTGYRPSYWLPKNQAMCEVPRWV